MQKQFFCCACLQLGLHIKPIIWWYSPHKGISGCWRSTSLVASDSFSSNGVTVCAVSFFNCSTWGTKGAHECAWAAALMCTTGPDSTIQLWEPGSWAIFFFPPVSAWSRFIGGNIRQISCKKVAALIHLNLIWQWNENFLASIFFTFGKKIRNLDCLENELDKRSVLVSFAWLDQLTNIFRNRKVSGIISQHRKKLIDVLRCQQSKRGTGFPSRLWNR